MTHKTIQVLFLFGILILLSCSKDDENTSLLNDEFRWTKSSITGLAGNNVSSLVIDDKGNKWFGTNNGLSKYDGSTWETYTRSDNVDDNYINGLSLLKIANNYEICLATNQGASVIVFSEMSNLISSLNYSTDSVAIASNVVKNVIVDSNRIKWFLTDLGLSLWGNIWHLNTDNPTIDYSPPICGAFSTQGSNYIGRESGSMIKFDYNEVDGVTGASEWIFPYNGEILDTVTSIFVSSKNELWLACRGNSISNPNIGTPEFPKNGLMRHIGDNPKSIDSFTYFNTAKGGLVNNKINYITESPDHKIWLGSEGGISKQVNETLFTNFTVKDGLCNNNVNVIAFDLDGSIWIGTKNGVSHLKDGVFTNFKASQN